MNNWRLAASGMTVCLMVSSIVARPIAPGTLQISQFDVADAIRAIVTNGGDAAYGLFSSNQREELNALYRPEGYHPLWTDYSGRPNRDARVMLALLSDAAREGLDPADYAATVIERQAAALDAGGARPPDVAAFDAGLSVNTLRYLRQLHAGRVDPRAIGFRMTAPADDHDFAALLRSAIASHRIGETATEFAPPFALYRGLRGMLLRYRSLASDTTLTLLPPPGAPVRPGSLYAGLGALHRRLIAFGDLPSDMPAPLEPSAYEGALIEGVKHFQIRHGLQADGVIGKDTWAALQVPLSWRVRQIELALERLRWLPHLGQDRFLAVNIPMFQLWGWDSIPPNGAPTFAMGVIVGRALNTQTPVFVDEMRYVIFRPYWNIPSSILHQEILPALRRDPDYLSRHDMEIVAVHKDGARPVSPNAESIASLRRGALRIRQRPGPNNSLGLVKFVFPNDANVYMHGTPAHQLFSRPRRDFSHGCIRVEDPVGLAEWVLRDQSEWDRDRIIAAMNASGSRQVNLTRPIQVILFYVTAVVMPDDGTIRFADDIYGHDARLDRALARQKRLFTESRNRSRPSR